MYFYGSSTSIMVEKQKVVPIVDTEMLLPPQLPYSFALGKGCSNCCYRKCDNK